MSNNSANYLNTSQQSVLAVFIKITSDPLHNWTLAELCELLPEHSKDKIFRSLHNLAVAELLVQNGDYWQCSDAVMQISRNANAAINRISEMWLKGTVKPKTKTKINT